MRLFIAEKPSLGRAIADVIGVSQKEQTHIVCKNGDVVTWCFGHLLELANPEEYGAQWSREALPIIPGEWKLNPRKNVKGQLAAIEKLLKKSLTVVHAGDPDREGQLLVDEVLERFNYAGHVQRIWLSSLDETSVRKALADLKPNRDFEALRDAARARSRADWLVGINATRAMTLLGRESGHVSGYEVLSIGRVQTPTLALIVGRDKQIEAFKAQPYLVLQAEMVHASGVFTASYVPEMGADGLDSEGRLIDAKKAASLVKKAEGKQGIVLSVQKEKKTKGVPLPHCLSSLQKAASAKFGMTAQKVLDTAQALYEKKLTTYPRTDCRYLPEEQFRDAPRILTALNGVSGLEAVALNADSALHGAVWDTKKVTAHHAIIPTGEPLPEALSEQERAIYGMIALAYCLQFHTVCEYEVQKITLEVEGSSWEAKGRVILKAGWTAYIEPEDEQTDHKEDELALPVVTEGDEFLCRKVEIQKKKTSPPKRFTEGSLIEAMTNVHRFLNAEETEAKAILKGSEGLGTEATRAAVIETLKLRGYIETVKKNLVSTDRGRTVIELCPEVLKDPLMTASWESRLSRIAEGKDSLAAFLHDQEAAIPGLIAPIFQSKLAPLYPCPQCGGALSKKRGTNGFYWACFNKEAHKNQKPLFFPDIKGKPVLETKKFQCPQCKEDLKFFKGKDGNYLWACFNKEAHSRPLFFEDHNGKPVFKK